MHIRLHKFLHPSDKHLDLMSLCSRLSSTETKHTELLIEKKHETWNLNVHTHHIVNVQNNWLLVSHLWQKLVTATIFWYWTKTAGKWQITLYTVCEHCYNEYYSNVVVWESINYKRWWRFGVINTQTLRGSARKTVNLSELSPQKHA